MYHQGLGIPYIGQVRENIQIIDKVSGCLESVLQLNGEDRACAFGQVFQLELMIRRGFEARVVNLGYLRMFFQKFCQFLGIGHMTFYAERQGFQTLDKEPGRDGGNGCTCITKNLGTDAGYKSCAWYIGGKVDTMIGSIGVSKVRISFRLIPVELSVFDNSTAQGSSMTTNKFSGRMNNYIKAMFQRPEEIGGGKSIINEYRQMMGMSNVTDCIKIRNIDSRVAQRFNVYSLCPVGDGCFNFFRMIRIYEFGMNTQLGKCIGEKFIGTAIKSGCRNDFITGAGNIKDRIGHCRCTAGHCQACSTSFQGSQSLFQYILSRVSKAAINKARFTKSKEIFPFLRIVEYIGSGLINRNSPGSCGGIRYLSCMLLKSFKTIFFVCHNNCLRILY